MKHDSTRPGDVNLRLACRLADVEMIFKTRSSSFKNLHDKMSSSATIFFVEIRMTDF